MTFPEAVENLLRPATTTGGGLQLSDLLQAPGLAESDTRFRLRRSCTCKWSLPSYGGRGGGGATRMAFCRISCRRLPLKHAGDWDFATVLALCFAFSYSYPAVPVPLVAGTTRFSSGLQHPLSRVTSPFWTMVRRKLGTEVAGSISGRWGRENAQTTAPLPLGLERCQAVGMA